ncbi:dual specificity protein phosphatase 15 isoform X2 [Strix uralensis]|uniref:dual specificity protein phosphatase 15 isoform X2 n=1 Tax=Strix uralensis TaxID=36305 RepID=UPI003DA75716
MGNGMSQILPGLYLGNFIDAKDLEQLSRNKITHIVSIHESPQPLLQDITYLRIPLPDTPEANIKRHFKECISFIHQCRLHGGNCLVHCLAGISRSTTVVVAYVMAVTELSCQEVLEAVRTVRPVANPNPGFKQQLAEFGGGAARKVGPTSATWALLRSRACPRLSEQGPGPQAAEAEVWDIPLQR